jgi:CheY-like chemotaxis protein
VAPISRKGPKRVTALVVDDDRDTREMYTLFLLAEGVNTVDAEDGLHGLAKATSIIPDVITTDLRLPKMDGVNLVRSLKGQARTRQIPVIAVTGATPGEVEAARNAGCVSVLLKPCLPETLLTEIKRVLALAS